MSISVVIPSYNRAAFLLSTLDSILAQTRPPDEVLVVDDGSTDHTALVLRNYAPRVRHLRIANSGDLVARNTGLRAARCERVAFCDSDDLWAPDYLAAMCALWRAEPRLVAAYGDFVTVRNDVWEDNSKFAAAPPGFWHGVRKLEPDLAAFDEPVMDRLLAYQPFFVSCLVADRVFFLRIGGWDEAVSRTVGCDFATALRIAEHAPIGLLRRPLVGIRKHDGNYSADVQAMNLGDSLVLEHVLATRPAAAAHAALIRASIARRRR
jgi:glycosyltransferase involved in cell wall biosynthesis